MKQSRITDGEFPFGGRRLYEFYGLVNPLIVFLTNIWNKGLERCSHFYPLITEGGFVLEIQ